MTSEVAFVDGDRQCVVKRCRDPIYLEWLSREHRVLQALAASPLPVPRVLDYADVDATDGGREAWLVMSRLEGRPLWTEVVAADSQRRAQLLRVRHVVASAGSTSPKSMVTARCGKSIDFEQLEVASARSGCR